jgi:hypothetical protein
MRVGRVIPLAPSLEDRDIDRGRQRAPHRRDGDGVHRRPRQDRCPRVVGQHHIVRYVIEVELRP